MLMTKALLLHQEALLIENYKITLVGAFKIFILKCTHIINHKTNCVIFLKNCHSVEDVEPRRNCGVFGSYNLGSLEL